MKLGRLATMVSAAVLLFGSSASAQRKGRERAVRPAQQTNPRRQRLEEKFRERSEQVVRQKLHLNDDQVARLRSVNSEIGTQRNALVEQERGVRSALRDEMAKGSGADQSRVTQLMAQARDLQSKRFALQQTEQQKLSGFMTPLQVAQYVGLQAQIRQRVRQMTQQGADSGGPPE